MDRVYSGIEKEYPHVQHVQILAALKGTKHSKVTTLGKMWNGVLVSRKRVQVEQNIGHMKDWRVLSGSTAPVFTPIKIPLPSSPGYTTPPS